MRIPRRRIHFPALLLCLLLPALAPTRAVGDQQQLRPLLHPGEKAPAFSLKDIDGNTISFRPGDGAPGLVVFWSVFCPLCREMMPEIERFAARHGKAVRVIAVNLDGKRFTNAVRAWLKEANPSFPVGLDELRDDYFVASDPYGLEKTPTVVLVDGDGFVRGAWAAEGTREFGKNADALVDGLQKGATPGK
jgi:cytochrome c biogenesis protein CcmG/thiol:disulfide interchange protein DsbE